MFFIQENPSLFLSIGNNLTNQLSVTNLTYGNTYQIACVALNSRPFVTLSIFANSINLNTFSNTTVSILQSYAQCDSNMVCTSGLSLSLTINDQSLKAINTLTCNALNSTVPYTLNTSIFTNVRVFVPPTVIIYSTEIPIARISGSSVVLPCNSTNPSTFWTYSNDAVNLFLIDNSAPTVYNISAQQTLTIMNIGQSNNGLYACGYSPSLTSFTAYITYKLFVEGNYIETF